MKSLNKVQLIGNLGSDPDLRYTTTQMAVCNLNVATTDTRISKQDGSKIESTEWHKIVVWGKLAENCAKYLSKGCKVYIEGSLKTRSWEDKATGAKRYATEINASDVMFLQIKPMNQAPAGVNAPAQPHSNTPATPFMGGMPPVNYTDEYEMDDIPF